MSPELPLEIVMQLFKRMGYVGAPLFFSTCANGCSLSHRRPRVILVEDHGILVGLVTVKDVLKFTAIEKPDGDASWDELRGGLEGLLEEVYTWTMMVVERLVSWYRRLFRG